MIDPTKIKIESHTAPIWEQEQSFNELMADQLSHAPWLLLSILIHAIAIAIFWMIPPDNSNKDKKAITMAQEEPPEEIPPEEEPEEKPEEETPEEEPELQDVEVVEETPVDQNFDDVSDTVESAFDSNQWNTAVGLGGGAGGKFGGRRGGRKQLAKGGRDTAIAIEMGLEWLKKHQDEEGKWDADDFAKHDIDGTPCDGMGNPVHDVGVTGLALLAFLGDGSTMRSGPYADEIKKAVRWLKDQQGEDGMFGTAASHDFIYDHMIAALAMCEAYGLSDYKLLRKYAQGGINYLEKHRNPYMVWRYQPRDNDNDTSVTGWGVMAYKSAQDFKLDVNAQALKLCETWFDQVTDPLTGKCGYTKRGEPSSRHPGDHSARFPPERGEALTAVGLMARFFLHQDPKENETMTRAATTILAKPPVWDEKSGAIDHYYWYYATYALYQMGEPYWKKWSTALSPAVVKTQRTDGNFRGSWDPIGAWGEDGGRVYSTAILVLTLEAYYRYSRVFVR